MVKYGFHLEENQDFLVYKPAQIRFDVRLRFATDITTINLENIIVI